MTGGAGFVGSSLALALKERNRDWDVTVLDNLKRRGSELALPRLLAAGVRFVHGDIRISSDLEAAGPCDLILECSAEPSVLAGLEGSADYVLDTNLRGTIHCLELARRRGAAFLFLSTSRVYPIAALSQLPLRETATRFELALPIDCPTPGLSERGIAEDFPLEGARSLYGATKLCSELLIAEYIAAYGLSAVVNRCGVIAGPWQMGRVDQGILIHWASSHLFGWPLQYTGYGGTGKQVRDILHVDDLADLVEREVSRIHELSGRTFNVGGGRDVPSRSSSSPSSVPPRRDAASRSCRCPRPGQPTSLSISRTRDRYAEELGWAPTRSVGDIVNDSVSWLRAQQEQLLQVFDPTGERRQSAALADRLAKRL